MLMTLSLKFNMAPAKKKVEGYNNVYKCVQRGMKTILQRFLFSIHNKWYLYYQWIFWIVHPSLYVSLEILVKPFSSSIFRVLGLIWSTNFECISPFVILVLFWTPLSYDISLSFELGAQNCKINYMIWEYTNTHTYHL